ncbi:UbiA prenyltransferase family [Dillenia turbinata]|uniref:Heme O synthase n=1 Tax=Dillenia turbinata TaxID=194707 RepID=A0AAN8UIR6_9MAGN
MWRTSISLSSKLSPNPNSLSTSSLSSTNYTFSALWTHYSRVYSAAASQPSSPPSSPDRLRFGLLSALGFSSSSTATVDAASSASSLALVRDLSDSVRHYGRCYWELSKTRLSMLVVATSGTGFVLGSGNAIDYTGLCCTCAGTMMVAASANSLNQVFDHGFLVIGLAPLIPFVDNDGRVWSVDKFDFYSCSCDYILEYFHFDVNLMLGSDPKFTAFPVFEIKNDAKMKRTRQRPLPSGRISKPHAITWATSVGVAGTALLSYKANALAAGLAASNLALYAFIYTPLKQIHPINTWVGAIVGAIPPLLGWVAACGQISPNAMILPAALYFWQLPHFMALAFLCRSDYAAGGFQMFSLYDASGRRTALVALRNCLYLVPLGFLAYDWGMASGWFCLESTLLTLAMSATAFSFFRDRTTKSARRMFHVSLLYLPVFMSGILFHRQSSELISGANSECTIEPEFSSETLAEDHESLDTGHNCRNSTVNPQARRSLVACASAAPFPFLPAPSYAAP